MRNITFLVGFICVSCSWMNAQNSQPQPLPCFNVTPTNSGYFNQDHIITSYCIQDSENSTSTAELDENSVIEHKASTEIYFDGEVEIAPNANGEYYGHIEELDFNTAWFEPAATVASVGKWNKMELGMQLPTDIQSDINYYLTTGNLNFGLNPYDPDQVDCIVNFLSPSGLTTKAYGFYFEAQVRDLVNQSWEDDQSPAAEFPWRVRFAPNETGNWQAAITFIVNNSDGSTQSLSSYTEFSCVPSNHKGKLINTELDEPSDRHFTYSETGEAFFGVGGSVSHSNYYGESPESADLQLTWLDQLGQNGSNFFRLEMSARNGLPDWDDAQNYDMRQGAMWEYDKYIDKAQEYGMYFTIYRHHIEVETGEPYDTPFWDFNPYKSLFNLTNRNDYFTNNNILQLQKKCLRYIFSRWGYTPNFAFYGYTEVNNWYKDLIETEGFDQDGAETVFSNWLDSTFKYINEKTNYASGMFACGYTSAYSVPNLKDSKVIPLCDMIPLHSYQDVKWGSYREFYNYIRDTRNKFDYTPIQIQETGLGDNYNSIYCCTDLDFHNKIWSGSMMNLTTTPLHWWWDRGIHNSGYYSQYAHVSSFFSNENLISGNYKMQRWADDSGVDNKIKGATIENFALKSDDKERVLGWVHNATYYWRNSPNTACIIDLVDNNNFDNTTCIVEDGTVMGQLAVDDTLTNFGDLKFADDYTFNGGVVNISNQFSNNQNPTFTVKGLNTNLNQVINPFAKKHWYKISYYATRGFVNASPIWTQVLNTNVLGQLKPNVPNLNEMNPDYSYKIEYIGKFSNEPSAQIVSEITPNHQNTVKENKDLEEIDDFEFEISNDTSTTYSIDNNTVLFPNPARELVSIKSKQIIKSYSLYNNLGAMVLYQSNVNDKNSKFNVSGFPSGVYVLKVNFSNSVIAMKLIVE
jgi:hypothetical protein